MVAFKLVLWLIAGFSTITFIVLFGHIPGLRRTPIGFLNRLVRVTLPRLLQGLDQGITGGWLTKNCTRSYRYLAYEAHPGVLIMYLGLLTGGILIFLARVARDLSAWHHIVIPGMIFNPYYTLYKAAFTNPGYISSRNHRAELARYPFDNILFRAGNECETCKREKPYVQLRA